MRTTVLSGPDRRIGSDVVKEAVTFTAFIESKPEPGTPKYTKSKPTSWMDTELETRGEAVHGPTFHRNSLSFPVVRGHGNDDRLAQEGNV